MMVNRLCIPPLLQVPPASRGEPFGSFAPLPQAPPTSQGAPKGGGLQKLHEACQQFEAVFLLQLWRAMQRTVPRERQTLNYAEMFDLTFAEYLARYGQFGIAEKLYEQLTRGGQTP
jgi:Rod binding domain-containing protein